MKLACLVVLAAAPLVVEANPYTYETIAFPGSIQTRALGINSSGTVLVQVLVQGVSSLYVWNDGVFTVVPLPFEVNFPSGGINDSGAITSNMSTQSGGAGFILNSGLTVFQVPGSLRTDALGINDSESVVGWSMGPSRTQGYFRSSTGIFSTIDVPNSTFTEADGINNTGDIVGVYGDLAAGHSHGFLLRHGVFSDVLYPQTLTTEAYGINDLGDIVGDYADAQSGIHGFVLSGGVYSTLDFPGAPYTVAVGINDSRSIVGLYGGPGGGILGFIASPVPEPSILSLLAGGLIGLAVALRRKSVRVRRLTSASAGQPTNGSLRETRPSPSGRKRTSVIRQIALSVPSAIAKAVTRL